MAEFPYLIAIALVEQEGGRAMPLGGKSLGDVIHREDLPGEKGKGIALELLLRLFQRTDENTLKRVAGEESLLIVEMPMEEMQLKLPLLKAKWLKTGDTENFMIEMKKNCIGLWTVKFVRYEGIKFLRYE